MRTVSFGLRRGDERDVMAMTRDQIAATYSFTIYIPQSSACYHRIMFMPNL